MTRKKKTLKESVETLVRNKMDSISSDDIDNLLNNLTPSSDDELQRGNGSGHYFVTDVETGADNKLSSEPIEALIKAHKEINNRLDKVEFRDGLPYISFDDLYGLLFNVHIVTEEGGFMNFVLDGTDSIFHTTDFSKSKRATMAFNVCSEVLKDMENNDDF